MTAPTNASKTNSTGRAMMRVSEAEESFFINSNMAELWRKYKKLRIYEATNLGRWLDFGDLEEVELDGSLAAEDTDENLDLTLGLVDGADGPKQVGKWPLNDLDGLADREGSLEFGCGLHSEGENSVDFFLGDGGRIIAGADEAGDSLGGADGEPGVVGDDHLHEHIAGEDLLLDGTFLAFADFDLVLGGNEDFVDVVGEAHGLDLGLEGMGGSGLVAGVGVDDVPFGAGGIVGVDNEVIVVNDGGVEFFNCFIFGHFVLAVYDATD